MANELFNFRHLVRPLTPAQRMDAVKAVVAAARLGLKYMYSVREVAGILHWSKDMVYDALHSYKIDAFHVLGLVRVAWWSLAEYLLDPAEDLDDVFCRFIESLPRKTPRKEESAC